MGLNGGPKHCCDSFESLVENVVLNSNTMCSDMWAPYLKVITKKAAQALNILEQFHIVRKLNVTIDEIRRGEANQFKLNKQVNVLERGRWLLLKKPENLSERQTARPGDLMQLNLASVKGYLIREDAQPFCYYQRPDLGGKFRDK